jgi:phage shock protein A
MSVAIERAGVAVTWILERLDARGSELRDQVEHLRKQITQCEAELAGLEAAQRVSVRDAGRTMVQSVSLVRMSSSTRSLSRMMDLIVIHTVVR